MFSIRLHIYGNYHVDIEKSNVIIILVDQFSLENKIYYIDKGVDKYE